MPPKKIIQYTDALFADNDPHQRSNVATVCPSISLIPISETTPLPAMSPFQKSPLSTYIAKQKLQTNLYYYIVSILLPRLQRMSPDQHLQYYDPLSGFQEEAHLEPFMNWLIGKQDHSHSHTHRAVLFDWDRTLSVFEGIQLDTSLRTIEEWKELLRPFIPKEYLHRDLREDMLEYVCGGQTRLAFLRDIFESIHEQGVHIIILTNNGGSLSPCFKDLIRGLIPSHIPFEIISGLKHQFHKGIALLKHPAFQLLCHR